MKKISSHNLAVVCWSWVRRGYTNAKWRFPIRDFAFIMPIRGSVDPAYRWLSRSQQTTDSGDYDPHGKTTPEIVGFRQPFETARRGGPDEQRSRLTDESEGENEGSWPISEHEPRGLSNSTEEDERTSTEHIEIAASDLVDRTKELIEEGKVRRLIIRNQEDEVLLEVPLTAGAVIGGAVTIVAPVLAALGALAALLSHVKIEVVRTKKDGTEGERTS